MLAVDRCQQAGAGMNGPIAPRDFRKNSRETLRLEVSEYRGKVLLNTRIWYLPTEGAELRPGRDGWAMDIAKLPEIAKAFANLETDARAAGLLP
jgi:hypothetical protein